MTERIVVDCDKCGKVANPHIRINIPQGSKRSTGSYPEDEYLFETKDLCTGCAASLLSFMLRHRKVKAEETDRLYRLVCDKVHPEGFGETDVIETARKYFGIKHP